MLESERTKEAEIIAACSIVIGSEQLLLTYSYRPKINPLLSKKHRCPRMICSLTIVQSPHSKHPLVPLS